MRRTLAAVLMVGMLTGCVSTPPASSPTAVAVASPTSAPVATTIAPSPTPSGRHVNPVIGYSVTLPPSWRVSECLSSVSRSGEFVGSDALTWRTAVEELDLGVFGGAGPSGAFSWIVIIEAQISSQTAMEFATARAGGTGGRLEPATLDGRPAVRSFDDSGNSLGYYVASAGRVFSVTQVPSSGPRPPQVTPATLDAIARSVTLIAPAARPTASPAPVMGPAVDALADALAAAFAASDADRVRDLVTPRCWFSSGYWQSEGTSTSRDKFVASLRTAFAQGLKVTVEPRPIRTAPFMRGSFWVWSTWSSYGLPPRVTPPSNVQIVFDQIDGRWYWVSALFNAER